MFSKQRRSLFFMLAGLGVIGLVAGFASGADSSTAGLKSYDVTLTPNYISPNDDPTSNYQAVWIYPKSPTTPYRSPDSLNQISRYLLLDPRTSDSEGRRGNDEWWFVIQRYWPSSYQPSNHGDWGTEVNFHNVAGDAGPSGSGGVGWSFGSGVSSLMLDWRTGEPTPQFGVEPNAPNENIPLPPVSRDTWHTYVVHFIAGRTDGSTVRPGALTVWADGGDSPVIDLSKINTVQRAQGPDGNWYTQRWMQLWEGDYTRNLQSPSTLRLALTRVGTTLAQALADRPTVDGTSVSGQYYSGSGVNLGPPSVREASPLTAADGAIPSSLGGSGRGPSPAATVVSTAASTPPAPRSTTTVSATTPQGPRRTLDSSDLSMTDSQSAITFWWDGVHFRRWSAFKSHLQSRGVEPNAFLGAHPAIVQMLSVSALHWERNRFFVRTALAKWLGKHGAGYTGWARKHADAASKLAP